LIFPHSFFVSIVARGKMLFGGCLRLTMTCGFRAGAK
jgi:hypothetical protein